MSSVLKRTCFCEVVGGTIRPCEWATVIVEGFGMMVEPFFPFEPPIKAPIEQIDYTDDFQKVNDFVLTDHAGMLKALNSGDDDHPWMHGGTHYPRTGR